ncbi:MAG: hypothetical protein EA376_06195 [Phycisphaeraceae bacterium]|nr:MAG: hypothetical protein EA376_06195 [Phycisphaeraceae bacterium]
MRPLTAAFVIAIFVLCQPSPFAWGWSAHGHRVITLLALDGLPEEAPDWLREAEYRHRIAHQSNEADRWRSTPALALSHVNRPDHYINIERLDDFGIHFEEMPRLRHEYLAALAVAAHEHPERFTHYDPELDADRSRLWPGFLPHAMAEHHAKLRASFLTLRIIEELEDPARANQLAQARANAIYHMGMLSHFVGDAAQPLHTTMHFNGWVGDNPRDYTTNQRFHAFIDGGVVRLHGITYESLRDREPPRVEVDAADPWEAIMAHIGRSFELVVPLYELELSGALNGRAGGEFIEERLLDAAATLSALYWSAWRAAEPTQADASAFMRFDEFEGDE